MSSQVKSKYHIGQLVRINNGVDKGRTGRITSIGGDNATYYGVRLCDLEEIELGYSEYELDEVKR